MMTPSIRLVADVLQIYKWLSSEFVYTRMKGLRGVFFLEIYVHIEGWLFKTEKVPTSSSHISFKSKRVSLHGIPD